MMPIPGPTAMTMILPTTMKSRRARSRGQSKDVLTCSSTTAETAVESSDALLDNSSYHAWSSSCSSGLKSCMTTKTQHESLTANSIDHLSSSSQRTTRRRGVRFDTVEFRSYPMILGDNPSTTCGPPVTLSWIPLPKSTLISNINSYEAHIIENGGRRSKAEFAMPASYRMDILIEAGYSRYEIDRVVQQVKKDKGRRAESIKQLKFLPVILKVVEAKSTFKKALGVKRR